MRDFTVHINHASLRQLLIQPQVTAQHMEYLATLQNDTYNIWYITDVQNKVADTLTRHPNVRKKTLSSLLVSAQAFASSRHLRVVSVLNRPVLAYK